MSEPKFVGISPITPETIRVLKTPDASTIEFCRPLPGNRWVCALLGLENQLLQFCVWDLQSIGEPEEICVSLSVTSLQPYDPVDWPLKLYPQLDKQYQVVNFLLYYMVAGTADCMLEVFQLASENGVPSLSRKASHRSLWEDGSLPSPEPLLDGDHVCIYSADGILLWNWKKDVYGIVPASNLDSEAQIPFLLQPPYIIPRMDSNPELFVMALERINGGHPDPSVLHLTPANLNIIGERENQILVRPVLFGRRWAFPHSAEFYQRAQSDTLLFSEPRSPRSISGVILPFKWSPSTLTLTSMPPLKRRPRSFDEPIKLPSGTLLFDVRRTGAGPQLPFSSEGREYPKVTWNTFYVHTESEKLGNINIVIPHSSMEVALPRVMNLCPLSGTIVTDITEGDQDEYGVLKVAITRILTLK